ncbi:MAG: energy transducer TonB [Treponema sp.]|jgi:protein TonB|nr:energy transducer TonB [Treponema sp.]
MDKIARTRFLLFIIVAALHGFLIFFLVFRLNAVQPVAQENAQVMKLADIEEFEELPPAPPPPPPPQLLQPAPDNAVESIAENIIETEEEPDQTVLPPGTLTGFASEPLTGPPGRSSGEEDYLPMHKISVPPKLLNERDIAATLRSLYPPIALRSGIEGRVILELFVNMNGEVKRIEILQETPKDRGFAEAAMKVFGDAKCSPAQANGEPVSVRWRYPVSFRIR